MATLGQTFKKYDSEIRLKIIKECTKFGVVFISKKYGINRNTINSWIRNFKAGKLNLKRGRISSESDFEERYEIQKKFTEFLKQERKNAQNLLEKIEQNEELKTYYENLMLQKLHITDKTKK
ncbi:hypothetical protein [Spiroplasma endosymbiont of Labia minor]|uniref:hypothetical protein n=1 Tax=Spiroplasma endosymbiont of Labia minor TaxID=3066305 RepID=UPI0030CFBDE5